MLPPSRHASDKNPPSGGEEEAGVNLGLRGERGGQISVEWRGAEGMVRGTTTRMLLPSRHALDKNPPQEKKRRRGRGLGRISVLTKN
jgi:hypothetical protein